MLAIVALVTFSFWRVFAKDIDVLDKVHFATDHFWHHALLGRAFLFVSCVFQFMDIKNVRSQRHKGQTSSRLGSIDRCFFDIVVCELGFVVLRCEQDWSERVGLLLLCAFAFFPHSLLCRRLVLVPEWFEYGMLLGLLRALRNGSLLFVFWSAMRSVHISRISVDLASKLIASSSEEDVIELTVPEIYTI